MAAKRVRMDPEARRVQFIDLGLAMLRDRPLEQVSIDAIAEVAGVSRALLFHYFDSKQDFHVAIADAQAQQMLEVTEPDLDAGDPLTVLATSVSAFIDYVSENREAYMAFLRGAAAVDPAMREVVDNTRAAMVDRVMEQGAALGVDGTPAVRVVVYGWLSFVEETTIGWLTDPVISRDELLQMLTHSLPALAAVVTAGPVPRIGWSEPAVEVG